jgi:hypothetical protein
MRRRTALSVVSAAVGGAIVPLAFAPAPAAAQERRIPQSPTARWDFDDDCRPQCVNLARTDRDIAHVEQQARHLAEIVADPLAPPIRHAREQHELTRLKQIIEAHEKGRGQQ